MGRDRRRQVARRKARELLPLPDQDKRPGYSWPLPRFSRSALLLGTLFAAALLPGLLAPHPAHAIPCLPSLPPGPIVTVTVGLSITCRNGFDRVSPLTTIYLETLGNGSFIRLNNSGELATLGPAAIAIDTVTLGPNSAITIYNSGDIATLALGAIGINASTLSSNSEIDILNLGDIATLGMGAIGINAVTTSADSEVTIINEGDIATLGIGAVGVSAVTSGLDSDITITNEGDIATLGMGAIGIRATTSGSGIDITNSGDIATMAFGAIGIETETAGANSGIAIANTGGIMTQGGTAYGIFAETNGLGSTIAIINGGDIATSSGSAHGIFASTLLASSGIRIENSGAITTEGPTGFGIGAETSGNDSPLTIINSGVIDMRHSSSVAIFAASTGLGSPLSITNSGRVDGGFAGIFAQAETTTIVNSGSITADSLFAIGVTGGEAEIINSGIITGFVDLFVLGDFVNQSGGVFEARQLSDFGLGGGRVLNREGATIHTVGDGEVAETTIFIGLERLENQGLISLIDGKEGDVFELTNCGCGVLDYVASGGATLGVDAFLGGPDSTADNFIIDGNTSGKTKLSVFNTNPGGGTHNTQGIPVVFANGDVKSDAFYLDKPIHAGLFDYDLFFRPTGSGVFELKSYPGGGSHSLPHIITTSQDLLHTSSETWLDRSADLRVLLNTKSHAAEELAAGARSNDVTPAVWVRGAGTWLSQDDRATTRAYGRTYNHTLDRDLEMMNFQTGVDLGKRDVLSSGDMLVFGPLAGVVLGSLDYGSLVSRFNFTAAEVGAYATYLKGGLFVDTQAKAHFLEVDPQELRGLPDTFNATNFGLRSDTGYRFGSFNGGMFVEPLATLGVVWTNIDTLAIDGNRVTFQDEVNVRGRLGLRVGTSYRVWSGTTMEPFVIGSVWSNLSGDNNATVISNDTRFEFVDKPEDLWSVVSAGVNFFNPDAQTTVFAKLDVTVGADTDGIGAKAGMRYNW